MTGVELLPNSTEPAAEQVTAAERWEIVTRAQTGDPEAFADLYRLYQPTVYRYIYKRTTNPELAEDLTADVFCRAIKSIHGVSWQGRDFGAWLITIARNIVWDHYKSGRQRLEVLPGDGWHPEQVDQDRRADPVQVALHNAFSPVLDAALAQLSDDQRQVLALRFGAGLSVAETARVMGKNDNAIKSAQHRAVGNMARLLRLAGETPC